MYDDERHLRHVTGEASYIPDGSVMYTYAGHQGEKAALVLHEHIAQREIRLDGEHR